VGGAGKALFVLWCLSWLPTVVGLLSERPGQPPTPQETAIRLTYLANALVFYLGGPLWLARRCAARAGARPGLAWLLLLLFNAWGPVALVIASRALGHPASARRRRTMAGRVH
jgi:hypothetical protein